LYDGFYADSTSTFERLCVVYALTGTCVCENVAGRPDVRSIGIGIGIGVDRVVGSSCIAIRETTAAADGSEEEN
jgi:hypothetical protein